MSAGVDIENMSCDPNHAHFRDSYKFEVSTITCNEDMKGNAKM